MVNYDGAIEKIKDLANEKQIAFFSLALLYLIFIAEYLKIRYKKAGISENIWRDTISDLKYKAFDTKALYGVWGMKSVAFEKGVFEMKTFERSQINGYDTLVMEMYIEQSGMKVTQIAVVVQVEDVTCLVVYTTEESFGRYDEFWDSVKTIQVGKAK